MKKGISLKNAVIKAVEKAAAKSAEASANSACYVWQHQPKEAAAVKKLRKFCNTVYDIVCVLPALF